MIKVLHVIDKMNPEKGGVCQAVRTIAFGLNSKGVQNEIVSLDNQNSVFLNKDRLTIHAIGPADNPWAYNSNLHIWLAENILRFNVIIVHGLWQYPSYVVNKILLKMQKASFIGDENEEYAKLFIMPHGMLDPYFQRASGRKLKALRNLLYWKLIEGKVVNNAYGLLFTCEAERKLAHEPFKPYYPKREFVVGLGVEAPPKFKSSMIKSFQKQCSKLKSEPYLLFLSRIHEKKGVDLLLLAYLKVITSIKEKRKDFEIFPKLVIAGPGIETSYGKKILEIVNHDSLLKQNVFFPGMLKGDAKWGAFYGCEAFLLPSHQENFGIAVVEALACNKPVLISNQVNIWTEIKEYGAGIVDEDTLDGTYNIIKVFMDLSPVEKEKMNYKARGCFEKYFAVEPATDSILKVISL